MSVQSIPSPSSTISPLELRRSSGENNETTPPSAPPPFPVGMNIPSLHLPPRQPVFNDEAPVLQRSITDWPAEKLHEKALQLAPKYQEAGVERQLDNIGINWNTDEPAYHPQVYTHISVLEDSKTGERPIWADPDVELNGRLSEDLRETVKKRFSYHGRIELDPKTGRPLNPVGRTGLAGRGLLGNWGPNHAADPIICYKGKIRLIQRKPEGDQREGDWAIPGGMVERSDMHKGLTPKAVIETAAREFLEETGSGVFNDKRNEITKKLSCLFEHFGKRIYQGYADDSRNTDNAWMETAAWKLTLTEDMIQWLEIDLDSRLGNDSETTNSRWVSQKEAKEMSLFAGHNDYLEKAFAMSEQPISDKEWIDFLSMYGESQAKSMLPKDPSSSHVEPAPSSVDEPPIQLKYHVTTWDKIKTAGKFTALGTAGIAIGVFAVKLFKTDKRVALAGLAVCAIGGFAWKYRDTIRTKACNIIAIVSKWLPRNLKK